MGEEKNKQLSVRISGTLHKNVKRWCVETNTKMQDFVEDALDKYLSEKTEAQKDGKQMDLFQKS